MTITERQLRVEPLHAVRQRTEVPANVYDHSGEIVVSAGAKVDYRLINQIRRRCGETAYVDQHWPTEKRVPGTHSTRRAPDPSDGWCKPKGSAESRGAPRVPWKSRLRVNLVASGDSRGVRTAEVRTHDISSGGMSFVSRGFVYPGTEIRATLDRLPNAPELTGVVRHCQHVGGRDHRVGVQFTGVSPKGERDLQTA